MPAIRLGDFGEIPLATIGDSAFPQYEWLLKTYYVNTRDEQQKYFNKRLCGPRVITEKSAFYTKKTITSTFQLTLRHHDMYCIV